MAKKNEEVQVEATEVKVEETSVETKKESKKSTKDIPNLVGLNVRLAASQNLGNEYKIVIVFMDGKQIEPITISEGSVTLNVAVESGIIVSAIV